MAKRWLRSRSGTCDDGSSDIVENINMDSDNTYLESEADIAVRADPIVEVSILNSGAAANDSNNATLSNITSQIQDLLTTVMTATKAESCKQTAAIQTEMTKLTETLKVQFKQENEKLAASLTERFEAANVKLREEFNIKLQHEIESVSGKVDTLKKDTEQGIDNVAKAVGDLRDEVSESVNAHTVQVRKELDRQGQEIIASSKVALANIREHQIEIESTVAKLQQEINQSREQVDGMLHTVSGELRTSIQECKSQIQGVKQANESEFMRVNQVISSLEAKIVAEVANSNKSAIPQHAVIGTTAVGTVRSESSVNGTNVCDMATCSDGANVPNASVNSCNNNVNAGSGL